MLYSQTQKTKKNIPTEDLGFVVVDRMKSIFLNGVLAVYKKEIEKHKLMAFTKPKRTNALWRLLIHILITIKMSQTLLSPIFYCVIKMKILCLTNLKNTKIYFNMDLLFLCKINLTQKIIFFLIKCEYYIKKKQ